MNTHLEAFNKQKKWNKELIAEFLHLMPDAAIVCSEQGIIKLINHPAFSLFGYTPDEIINQPIEILIPSQYRETHVHQRGKYRNAPVTRTMGKCVGLFALHKNGQSIPVDIMLQPFQLNDELCILSVVRDITPIIQNEDIKNQIIKIEQQLKDSEEYYRTLTENSSDIITIIASNGKIRFISPCVTDILGYHLEELIGKTIFELIPSEMSDITSSLLTDRVSNSCSSSTMEFKIRHKDGTWRILEAKGKNLNEHPLVNGYLINAKDITHRKKVERKLQFSNEILHHIGTLVVVTDASGNVIYCSPSVKKILGYTPHEMLEEGWWKLTYKNEKQRKKVKKVVINFANKSKALPIAHIERNVGTKDGQTRYILWQHEKGPHETVIAVGHDITERKELEERLKIKNRELNTFVYKTSHDLKSPLSSILGLVNLAQISIKDNDSLAFLDMIQKTALRGNILINNLLTLSTSLQGQITKEQIDINQLVQEIIETFQFTINGNKTKFLLECSQTKKVCTDKKLLHSVIQNLIENGIKYNNKPNNKYIKIRINNYQKGIKIKISDNGCGIPKDLRKKVFHIFFRGNNNSTGTGLGLYLVKTNMEKLGGNISIKSEVDKGTTFTVSLPE